jgi:hypothetical protein
VNVYLRLQLTCLLLSAICCCRLCLFTVLLDACPFCFLQYTALPAFFLQFVLGVALPCSPVEHATLQLPLEAFPSPSTLGEVVPLLPSLAHVFIYSSSDCVPLPHSPELRAPRPLCYVSFFFFSAACLLFSLFFSSFLSPVWGSVCPGGYAALAQGCLWEYCMQLSSPGGLLLPSRIGAGIWWHGNPPVFSI